MSEDGVCPTIRDVREREGEMSEGVNWHWGESTIDDWTERVWIIYKAILWDE